MANASVVNTTRHNPSEPFDLRDRVAEAQDPAALQLMRDAARQTVLRFEGGSPVVLAMLGLDQ